MSRDWAPLFRFDDGFVIGRAMTAAAVKKSGFGHDSWRLVQEDKVAVFALFQAPMYPELDHPGLEPWSAMLFPVASDIHPDPWNRLTFQNNHPFGDHVSYWWTFAAEMMFPFDKAPQGRWRYQDWKVPIVYDDRLEQRLQQGPEKDAYDAAMANIRRWYSQRESGRRMSLGELEELKDDAREKAYAFVMATFGDIYTTVPLSEYVKMTGEPIPTGTLVRLPVIKAPIKVVWIGEDGPSYEWAMRPGDRTDLELISPYQGFASLGTTLYKAWRGIELKHWGPLRTRAEFEAWSRIPGEPLVDVDVYLALDAGSPLLWKQSDFEAWYTLARGPHVD